MKSSQFSSLHEPDHTGVATFVELNAVERRIDVTTQTLDTVFPTLQAKYGFARPFLKWTRRVTTSPSQKALEPT